MKNGQIFAKKSTQRGPFKKESIEYLDETSKLKKLLRTHSQNKSEVGKKLKAFFDYASKETVGQVHVGGFFHHLVCQNSDGTNTGATALSNEERKKRLIKYWTDHLGKYPSSSENPVVQHRLIFSMSREQHDAFVARGINPDEILHTSMKKAMKKFTEKFHRNDSIGYAYGLHHDTDHLHVHIGLCPRTKRGRYVGCSTSSTPEKSGNKNQMDYIRACFELENKRWEKLLSQPEKLEEILSKRLDSHKIVFHPKLTAARKNQLVAEHNQKAQELLQLYTRINALELSFQKLRQQRATRKTSAAISRFLSGFSRKKSIPLFGGIKNIPYQRVREQQQVLFRLKREYRALYNQYQKTYRHNSYGAHQTAKQKIHGYRNSAQASAIIQ